MRIAFLGNFGVSYSSETHHARSLAALGHTVIQLQEPRTPASVIQSEATQSDLFVWVHTHGWQTPNIEEAIAAIKRARVPVVAYHLDLYLPLPRRWAQYQNDPYMRLVDHWFTVDPAMAEWLNTNTDVHGHYLPAGVFGDECYISEHPSPHANDVVFVGSRGYHSEWPYRPQLINWLRDTYGPRFTHVGGDGDTGTVRGDDLNAVYARSKIAIGDSLCVGFNYPGYWSDRVYETIGRGGFIIHPAIPGIEQQFKDDEHLALYDFGDFDQLRFLIDYHLEHDDDRETIRRAGHQLVKSRDTYKHRWQTILDTVFG